MPLKPTDGPTSNHERFEMDSDQIAHSDIPAESGKGRSPLQMLIGGVVALLVIAGVVVVGAQVTGSRSGSAYSGLTCSKTGSTAFGSTSGYTSATYTWYDANNNWVSAQTNSFSPRFSTPTYFGAARVQATLTSGSTSSYPFATCS